MPHCSHISLVTAASVEWKVALDAPPLGQPERPPENGHDAGRELGSRFARLGRSQYETTRSAENRRGGDAYGWHRAEARAGSRPRENLGFRADLGSKHPRPDRHRGPADAQRRLSRLRYALRHQHRVEGAAADGRGPYRRGGRVDLDPEASRQPALP